MIIIVSSLIGLKYTENLDSNEIYKKKWEIKSSKFQINYLDKPNKLQ